VLAIIEGPTLADHIAAGAVPLEDARRIATQICDALEYAHDRGGVHRELKPANLQVTPDGNVKVLDFGLAKVLEDEPSPSALMTNSPTLTIGHTRAGMIPGAVAYMSPEQAGGRPVDRRTDIFSFGSVLYEMHARLHGKHHTRGVRGSGQEPSRFVGAARRDAATFAQAAGAEADKKSQAASAIHRRSPHGARKSRVGLALLGGPGVSLW
jgi:serine/threonine protein kinase